MSIKVWTPRSPTSGLQDEEKMNFCCLSRTVRYFVTAAPANSHTLCFPRPKTQKQTPHHPLCLPVIWFLCSPLPSSPGCPLLMQPHTLSPVRVPFQNPAHDPCSENPFPTSLQGCVASSRSPPREACPDRLFRLHCPRPPRILSQSTVNFSFSASLVSNVICVYLSLAFIRPGTVHLGVCSLSSAASSV